MTELTAALAGAPEDTGLRCELGFALVNLERWAEAHAELDRAIAALGEPTDDRLRRRLGACIYNRGLAALGAADLDTARRDFARSIAVRPNEAVAGALAALSGTATETALHGRRGRPLPRPTGRAARDDALRGGRGAGADRHPAGMLRPGRVAVVTPDTETNPERYAVRFHDGRAQAVLLATRDDWGMAGHPDWRSSSKVRPVARRVCALVTTDTESGDYGCDIAGGGDAAASRWSPNCG